MQDVTELVIDEQTFTPHLKVTIHVPLEPLQDAKAIGVSEDEILQRLGRMVLVAMQQHMQQYKEDNKTQVVRQAL